MTRSQIDRLGKRLSKGHPSPEDLQQLETYRRTFTKDFEAVVQKIRETLDLDPTRREKTIKSIIDKLRRESIRLSQMQDVAGCRLVVEDVPAQARSVERLVAAFPGATVIDRRVAPTHGYRAVHMVVRSGQSLIEIQVRTVLQDLWATLSEKLADKFGIEVKYGGGPEFIRTKLAGCSVDVADVESAEKQWYDLDVPSESAREWPPSLRALEENYRRMMEERRRELAASLRKLETWLQHD